MIKLVNNRTWEHHWIDPSSYRGRTGLSPDPSYRVNYKFHPYDNDNDNDNNNNADSTTIDIGRMLSEKEDIKHLYKPIRISYFTFNLESHRKQENSESIDFVENIILPKVVELWSNTLSVIPTDGPLKINPRDLNKRQFCGFPDLNAIVPDSHMSDGIPDTDVAWYITASDNFCQEGTLALAMPCNFDQFDRPTAGVINFCLDSIKDIESESDIQNTFFIAAHEAGHVLGLVATALPYFYDSDTGKPRTKRPFKQTKVTCVTGREQTVVMVSNYFLN